jgi:hypothetical protein
VLVFQIELDDADAEDDKAAPVCRSSPPFPVRERSPSLIFCRRVDHLNQVDDSRFL